MKKHIKKLTAALLTVAMTLSLAVSASAANITDWGDSAATQTANGTVNNQGAMPAEVVNVVMPVASTNAFGMIFDAKDLITTTKAEAFKPDGTTNPDDYDYFATFTGKRFFFQNVAEKAAVAKYDKLAHDISIKTDTANYVPAGTKVAVYAKVTTNTVYAKLDDDGKLEKWVASDGSTDKTSDVNTAVTGSDALTGKDFFLGTTKDTIATVIKNNPVADFKATGQTGTGSVAGLAEYTYKTYDETSTNLRYLLEAKDKVYSNLGDASNEPTADSAHTNKAALDGDTTNNYVPLPQVKTNFVTYKPTSNEVEIINKGNKPISVSMKAELSGIADTTYTYAAGYDSANDKFKDADGADITTGAVIYLALEDGTPADTSVMTYSSTTSKATAKINATLAALTGTTDFVMEWDSTAGKYVYTVDKTLATADFPSLKLKFTGAINDDDAWSTLPAGAAMSVTWNVKASKVLTAPTVAPAAFQSGKTWTVNISGNKDNLTIAEVNAYPNADGTGTATKLTVSDKLDATTNELVGFTVSSKNLPSAKPASIKVTFQDPTDADFTVTVLAVVT
jgi:hypothetical protein